MRFRVHCTSYGKPPCEVHIETELRGDIGRKDWCSVGRNRRTEHGVEMRDCWFIEMATIEELLALSGGEGIILSRRNGMPDIEIYDDYRE